MVGLREVPCEIRKLNNGYSEVTFQIDDDIINRIVGIPHKYNGRTFRSIFVEHR